MCAFRTGTGDSAGSQSSSPANRSRQDGTMAISSSELALTGTYPPSTFTSFQVLKETVAAKAESLRRGGGSQHISLKHVERRDFKRIESRRRELGSGVRFTYFPDIQTLIVKVPSAEHENAHTNLGQLLTRKVDRMNVPLAEFVARGATRYEGPTQSSKECDSSWNNSVLRPRGRYPSLVIEAGVSESLPRLRADAAWWFSNSDGDVRLVLLIKVSVQQKTITVEKYDRVQAPPTRRNPRGPWRPRKLRTITINQEANPPTIDVSPANAAPPSLTLEFDLVFGRAPVPPLERDIVFTDPELLEWARIVFL